MKLNILKCTASALVCALSITGGVTAFAETTNAYDTMLITDMEETVQLKYTKFSGRVTSLNNTEDGYISLTISDDYDDVLTINTISASKVFDAENKNYTSLAEIKEGDNLTVIVDTATPMILSLPPQINNAAYIIKTNDFSAVKVDLFDKDLTSSDNSLVLNISPEAYITDIMGSRKIFTSDDIKNSHCAVVYSFATMSIPAQTNPEAVIILESADIDEASYNMPLRSTFESMGYNVKWTSNAKPIVIKNDINTIEVTIGSKSATINGVSFELDNETVLINGITCVDSSILKLI